MSVQHLCAIFALVASGLHAAGESAPIQSGRLVLQAAPKDTGVTLRLADTSGVEFAAGTVLYAFQPSGAERVTLKAELRRNDAGGVQIVARGGGLEVTHEITRRPANDGFEERISVLNVSAKPVQLADYHFALSRPANARGNLRAVAVPFRRQADNRLRDYSLEDIAAGKAANSDWTNDRAVLPGELIDSRQGRLRSEGWILTDGSVGLLVAKYNNDDIEHSMLQWQAGDSPALLLGGSAFALHREPESMQRIEPGQRVSLGTTYYLAVHGDWPAGYEVFRKLLGDLGHGLTADYNPPINWNELFDVGWYHSDAAALAQHYTRDALLKEAAKARDVGATALYLDPGWEVCEGTTRWAEDRLGKASDLVRTLREDYGLDLAFRTIGRAYRDEFPKDWYMQHAPGRPYERPLLNQPPPVEPVPTTDERGHRNVALLPAATARASSCLPGHAVHRIEHLIDGWYNNPASWISDGEPSWIEIDLGSVHNIDCVRLGSEHTPWYRDRLTTQARVLVTGEADANNTRWEIVAADIKEPLSVTRAFTFTPRPARRVRIEIAASAGGNARIDEVEIYESEPKRWDVAPRQRTLDPAATQPTGDPIAFWEVCTQCSAWQAEKLDRIERVTAAGMKFIMFDEFDWRGSCYATHHGHAAPTTPEGHARAVYKLVRETKKRVPGVLVEAHDPVWPWGVRYLPIYFDQTLDPARRPGSYDENWGFEFMWNPIEDLTSGRALCLYYYNLACDIPLYDHITAENDNDACLAFWWYASTVRHLGIGGKKGLGGKQENETRWQAYKQAMAQYRKLRDFFVRGQFIGLDELTHLHVLPGKPGGVLVVFNLTDKPVERSIKIDPAKLHLNTLPAVKDARVETNGSGSQLIVTIPPLSPRILEIGL